ncbi:MAG: hypothetical protein ABR84_08675 [Cryomorphaceae bacterium BACL21 MAG-121220-bin10]|jgi:hypothetical protein|nr:MAG: hypothetical protein ABR84_08675 [Cryomorphaceae bacterium BACL21 MAG-121220-bin10]|tara:strand:- start:35213 stop:35419 length:207 start_codon:yes stop_codon:yes gene_type:complete
MMFLYFDAGLAAMLVQAIVAAAAGILLFSKNVMYQVKSFFGLTKTKDDTYDSIDLDDDDTQNHDTKQD